MVFHEIREGWRDRAPRGLVLAVLSLSLSGACISHEGPGADFDASGMLQRLNCPAADQTIAAGATTLRGDFSGASRWFARGPGSGPQRVIVVSPSSCTVTLTTCGSSVDTTLASTTDCVALERSDDDGAGCGNGARITVPPRTTPTWVALG
jgi:hypothetical protein